MTLQLSFIRNLLKLQTINEMTFMVLSNQGSQAQSPFPRPMALRAEPISVFIALGHAFMANVVRKSKDIHKVYLESRVLLLPKSQYTSLLHSACYI